MSDPTEMRPSSGVWAALRKTALLVVGGGLTLVGIVLLVVPGPGIPLIIAGLAILSPEFPWARRQRERLRNAGRAMLDRRRSGGAEGPGAS